MKTYKVLFPHLGDKNYAIGDTRQADPHEVQHLVENGMLEDPGAKKADGAAPSNKAEPAPKNKTA